MPFDRERNLKGVGGRGTGGAAAAAAGGGLPSARRKTYIDRGMKTTYKYGNRNFGCGGWSPPRTTG